MTRLEANDTRSTVTVRIDEELKEDFKQKCNGSMSESIRNHIKSVVDDDSDAPVQFDDEILTEGFRALCNAVEIYREPGHRQLPVRIAVTEVANATDVPKKAVKDRILTPLEDRNAIRPNAGSIVVRDPAQ